MSTQADISGDCVNRISIARGLLLTGPLVLTATSAISADNYLHRMLFSPSESMLEAEAEGYIMIYDGLDSETVDRFMSEQFDRIESAMFVRIHHAQENGEYLIEDDGCD